MAAALLAGVVAAVGTIIVAGGVSALADLAAAFTGIGTIADLLAIPVEVIVLSWLAARNGFNAGHHAYARVADLQMRGRPPLPTPGDASPSARVPGGPPARGGPNGPGQAPVQTQPPSHRPQRTAGPHDFGLL